MRKIAMVNQKGGTGKTTTAVNLGACLGKLNKAVLLIDIDPQAHATIHLGITPHQLKVSIYDVLMDARPLRAAILKTEIKGLEIVPSTIDLAGAEIDLVNTIGRENILRDRLETLNKYHYILIDCPPSLGLLTLNALTAADEVIIPIQTEFFALEGVGKLLNTIKVVKTRLNHQLKITGIIPVMFDTRTSLSQEVLTKIIQHFKNKVYKTKIRRNIKLAEAPSHGKPIFLYAPNSYGARDYEALTQEVLSHE